jgi:hypothetical protein
VRALFEPRFGHDFGAVHIHTGQAAGDVAQSLGASVHCRHRPCVRPRTVRAGDRGGPTTPGA